jgi:hypothetical protein
VEADNLEEAKKLAEDAEWDIDDGGEHYLEDKSILESDTEDDIDSGKYIEWND